MKSGVNVDIKNLKINNENPRFSKQQVERKYSELDCAIELIQEDEQKMANLVIQLSENYESAPFILFENGKGETVLMDGNRRLTAIKLLKKMIFLPEGKFLKVEKELLNNTFNYERVNCDIYDASEEKKMMLKIQRIHTRPDNTRVEWHPFQKHTHDPKQYQWMILYTHHMKEIDFIKYFPKNIRKMDRFWRTHFHYKDKTIWIDYIHKTIVMQESNIGNTYVFEKENCRKILEIVYNILVNGKYIYDGNEITIDSDKYKREEIMIMVIDDNKSISKKHSFMEYPYGAPKAKTKTKKEYVSDIILKQQNWRIKIDGGYSSIVDAKENIKIAVDSEGNRPADIKIEVDDDIFIENTTKIRQISAPFVTNLRYSFFDKQLNKLIRRNCRVEFFEDINLFNQSTLRFDIPLEVREFIFDRSIVNIIAEVEQSNGNYSNLVASGLRVIYDLTTEKMKQIYNQSNIHFKLPGGLKNEVKAIWGNLVLNKHILPILIQKNNLLYSKIRNTREEEMASTVDYANKGAHCGKTGVTIKNIEDIIDKQSLYVICCNELIINSKEYLEIIQNKIKNK